MTIDAERIEETPKRVRTRLAKAELWMAIAYSHAVNDLGKGIDERGYAVNQPGFVTLDGEIMRRYGLTPADIQRIGKQIGDEIETKGMQCGYENVWMDE